MLDRIHKLLESTQSSSTVIACFYDWSGAFDRVDPTIAVSKFIKLGIRSSLIPVLADFLSNRKMVVKMNGHQSDILDLIGGGPQGSILGQHTYLAASDEVPLTAEKENAFKYIDDLTVLDIIQISGILVDYDVWQHVPSDIATDQRFLATSAGRIQSINDDISNWTEDNLMQINTKKTNYMVINRVKEDFATRYAINKTTTIDRVSDTKILGVWLSDDLSWYKNCKEICSKAYMRMSMLSKLKYVGLETEQLIDIYKMFIRSVTEYCSTAFHSSLTQSQTNKLEMIQKVSLKIILAENYVSYAAALEMTGLTTLSDRRQKKALNFGLKALKLPQNRTMFPPNQLPLHHDTRHREKFHVNFAVTEKYKNTAIPYLQRELNKHFEDFDVITDVTC